MQANIHVGNFFKRGDTLVSKESYQIVMLISINLVKIDYMFLIHFAMTFALTFAAI